MQGLANKLERNGSYDYHIKVVYSVKCDNLEDKIDT